MSSEVDGAGLILLPAGLAVLAVYGAAVAIKEIAIGVVSANQAMIRAEAETKERIRREAEERARRAKANREQIVSICQKAKSELSAACSGVGSANTCRFQELISELDSILDVPPGEGAELLEEQNAMAFCKVRDLLRRCRDLIGQAAERSSLCDGYAVADLMDDLRMALASAELKKTVGENAEVHVDDYERRQLNRRLDQITARISDALGYVADYSSTIGLDSAQRCWYAMLFGDVDRNIAELRSPAASVEQVKKGILRLEKNMQEYDMLHPTYLKKQKQILAMYDEYRKAAEAMMEKPLHVRAFNGDVEAIQRQVQRLAQRAERAEECRRIYEQYGPEVYQCYAWDMELKAMGYTVFKRKQFRQLAFGDSGTDLEKKVVAGQTLPFYNWGTDGTVTQLYEIGPGCALQLKLNPDGSTTMQTVDIGADGVDNAAIQGVQKKHCSAMKELKERLRRNWFIYTDLEELESAEQILSVSGWRNAEGIVEAAASVRGIAGTAATVQARKAKAKHSGMQ